MIVSHPFWDKLSFSLVFALLYHNEDCLVCSKFLTWLYLYTSDITASGLLQPLWPGPEVALLTGVYCTSENLCLCMSNFDF